MARADAGLTISELAQRAGVSRDTISNAERGHHSLQASTLSKIARALGKTPSELLAEEERLVPKETRRSSFEPSFNDVLEEGRRAAEQAATPRVLREYMMLRAEGHDREMRGPESPHFRTATAATLWLDDLYAEMRDWCTWVYVHRSELLPDFKEGASPEFWRAAFHAYLAPIVAFQTIRKQAENRIAEMADAPDELAVRRKEATREEAEQARRQFEAAGDVG